MMATATPTPQQQQQQQQSSVSSMFGMMYAPSNDRPTPAVDVSSRKRDEAIQYGGTMAPMRGATRFMATNIKMNRHLRPKTKEFRLRTLTPNEFMGQMSLIGPAGTAISSANGQINATARARALSKRLGKTGSTFAKRRGDTWKDQPPGWANICDMPKGHKRYVKTVPLSGAVDHASIQSQRLHQIGGPNSIGNQTTHLTPRVAGVHPDTNPYSMETYKATMLSTDMTNTPHGDRRSNTFGLCPEEQGFTQAMGEGAWRAGNVASMPQSGPRRGPPTFEANPDLTAPSDETAAMVGVFPDTLAATSYSTHERWNMGAVTPHEPDPYASGRISRVINPLDRQGRASRTPNQTDFFQFATTHGAGAGKDQRRPQGDAGTILMEGQLVNPMSTQQHRGGISRTAPNQQLATGSIGFDATRKGRFAARTQPGGREIDRNLHLSAEMKRRQDRGKNVQIHNNIQFATGSLGLASHEERKKQLPMSYVAKELHKTNERARNSISAEEHSGYRLEGAQSLASRTIQISGDTAGMGQKRVTGIKFDPKVSFVQGTKVENDRERLIKEAQGDMRATGGLAMGIANVGRSLAAQPRQPVPGDGHAINVDNLFRGAQISHGFSASQRMGARQSRQDRQVFGYNNGRP